MEHPLISGLDELKPDQLMEKITELSRKLNIAMSMGNYDLCNQIRMALESYQSKYQEKIRKDSNTNFDDIIDIS